MTRNVYSEEFKLAVVNDYLKGNLGVRLIAKKYNLPSKNYITKWINKFKEEGKIPSDIYRDKTQTSSKKSINNNNKTEYEKLLEKKVYELEAQLAVYKKYEELLNKSNKKK